MIVETGHYALVLAFAVALVQFAVPLWGASTRDGALTRIAPGAAFAQFALVALAFAALTHAHLVSDFSLTNVVENSHSAKPLIYKFSGVWGNHEGSMLLWVLILALFGALVALFGRDMPGALRATVLAVQGLIAAAFLIFILITSNPFARLAPAPFEGNDLNPVLQDIGLAIHPPLLYLGYVGFSIVFSFAAAALINGRIDAAWARWVRPWILTSWIFLTLGIAMGSYWAYYTLGWGGFWFWDPVENASLLPWLSGTALLHSAIVMERRDALKIWTVFLAILTFSLSLLGTFLVRSGVLTSVHSFASDPTRGVFILAILVFFIGGAFSLYAWRAQALRQGGLFAPVSREGALVLNNLLLTTCCATVFVGTLYPLALEVITGERITVGGPFFNLTFGPLFAPLFLLMPFGQGLAWKRGDLAAVAQRMFGALVTAFAAAILLLALTQKGPWLAPLAMSLAVFSIVGSLTDLTGRIWQRGMAPGTALARAAGLPRAAYGASLAHIGIAVTLAGLAATGWGVEKIETLRLGESVQVGPYQLNVAGILTRTGPNYRETFATVSIRSGGVKVAVIEPAKRFYPARQMQTSLAGIATLDLGQIYVSLAEQEGVGSVSARLYWKPLITLIWIGALIMGLGGALSLSDRRLRKGIALRLRKGVAGASA